MSLNSDAHARLGEATAHMTNIRDSFIFWISTGFEKIPVVPVLPVATWRIYSATGSVLVGSYWYQ
jgi:hypothetical protein